MSDPTSENNVLGHFTLNYKHIITDEIALEGLEGITLDLLWRRISLRISAPVTEKMKVRFWRIILESRHIFLYHLPEPLPHLEIRDRFTVVDRGTGDIKDPGDFLDGPYEYYPAPGDCGSSKYYLTRTPVLPDTLLDIPYEKIESVYGYTLVLVASLEKRCQALGRHIPITHLLALVPIQYCMLELIGKSRDNGQMTVGTTNITKIVKEPKTLFYHRKFLKNLGLIKVTCMTQLIGNRLIKSLLLRLNRFHQPMVLSLPKVGKMHNVIEYLRGCPNYAARSDILISAKFFTQDQSKKIRKNNNIFEFYDQEDDTPPKKKQKVQSKRRRCICLVPKSDESSQSEEETTEQPVKNQFKIGVGVIRQAYELFLEAGLKGISQTEIGTMLGIEFYNARMLCRYLKSMKLVREYFEDKGRQRIFRYVAIAAGLHKSDYAEEKNKFLELLQNNPNSFQLGEEPIAEETSNTEIIIPHDIASLPETVPEVYSDIAPAAVQEYETTHISELSVSNIEKNRVKNLVDETNKTLSLRQLKFANGLLKIVYEKKCITGYQTLSNMVGKEINAAPMGTKALKAFLNKLVAAGQIKVFRVRWPGRGNELNYMNLICAPNINITDPIIRNKYKEVHLRAMAKRTLYKKDTDEEQSRPLSMYVNPRYMKIQKLHEALMLLAYFEPLQERAHKKHGFLTVTDLMPEMTVKFAISNMSTTGLTEIADLKVSDEHINMKLKNAPSEIAHGIMKSNSLRNSLRMNLKALGMYGLIQLIWQPDILTADYVNSSLTSFLFYVNRNATLVKTRGNWPRECNIEDLEIKYYFETVEDVKRYWRDVYDISIDTTIVLNEPRAKKTLFAPVRKENEVHLHDNGLRYGDGKGPCGLDSCFYLEVARLWRTYYVREGKPLPKPKPKKAIVKVPKITKAKRKARPRKKKPQKVINPVMKVKAKRGRRKMPDMTIIWTKEEDDIIMMSFVAIVIVSPSSQPGSLRVRNLVTKDILTLKDEKKTQSVCHRRAMIMQSNPTIMHEKDSLLSEMRRRRHLIYKYEGLVKKLRIRYSTNMSKFMNEARIPMLELMWLIWQVSKSESYLHRVPCVAINVSNFRENFSIVVNTANKMYNIYKSPELAMLREAVFLTVMLTFNNYLKSNKAKEVHAMMKKYPEHNLRIVVEQLRKSGAISAKEKIFNNQMHRLNLEDISTSAYKVSMNYQRRWVGKLSVEFTVALSNLMECNLPITQLKGSAEMNCLLCETQALGYLEIRTAMIPSVEDHLGQTSTASVNVTDIETKHQLKSGSIVCETTPSNSMLLDQSVSSLYQDLDFKSVLADLEKTAIACCDTEVKQEYDLSNVIIRHLNEKCEKGSSFKELQEITKFSSQDLANRLHQLESGNIIKRVGLQDNIIVLLKYIKDWTFKHNKKYVIITPWLNLDFEIRIDIFLEWTGIIINRAFEQPGSSIASLSDSFELITCRALQDACMYLEATKCISLKVVKCPVPDLYSDTDEIPEITEFNKYESTENICVFPVKDSLTRYAHLRKLMMDKHLKEKLFGNV